MCFQIFYIYSQHLLFAAVNVFGCGELQYKTLVGENDMSLEKTIVWKHPIEKEHAFQYF